MGAEPGRIPMMDGCFEAVASVTLENCWTWSNGYKFDGSDPDRRQTGTDLKWGNYTENDITLKNCLAFSNKSKGFDQNHTEDR